MMKQKSRKKRYNVPEKIFGNCREKYGRKYWEKYGE